MIVKHMLERWEAEELRARICRPGDQVRGLHGRTMNRNPPNWCVGDFGIVEGTGRATCRECGVRIAKGESAIECFYDHGGGSWTSTRMLIHLNDCGDTKCE
jgi:hypothetical protein